MPRRRVPGIGVFSLPGMWLGALRLNVPAIRMVEQREFFRAPAVSSPSGLPVLDTRLRGTTYIQHDVKSVVNSPENTGMGFWSVNPFVGCEFGCSYCYARYAHRYVVERARDNGLVRTPARAGITEPGWQAFEEQIFVKSRADVLSALDRDLLRVLRRHNTANPQTVVIGTATDPYQPAERRFRVTRAVLERLGTLRGLSIGIISKSTLITRDIDVLQQLGARNQLTIYVSLISTQPQLIRIFEPRSPLPHARLRSLRKLRDAGLNAGVIVAPVLPGITDSVFHIDALMRAAKKARAAFVQPSVLRLDSAVLERFVPLVEQHFPTLAPRYRAAYAGGQHAPQPYIDAVTRRFRRIAHRRGIAARNPLGSDEPAKQAQRLHPQTQLTLL